MVVKLEEKIYAFDAECPHLGAPLEEGTLWDGSIECPWHHYIYDIRSGANLYPRNVYPEDLPDLEESLRPLRIYPVSRVGDSLWVELPTAQGNGDCRI